MVKHEIRITGEGPQDLVFSVEELCEICHITPDFIADLIAYDILPAAFSLQEQTIFNTQALRRIQIVLRLQHDLEINLAGIAVVLDLLDELQELRAAKQVLEKLLSR